jgi:glycosyltransferase involved in cell wall biosynthesis
MQSLEAMSNSAENIHSLFLSAWYPNRHDAMSGLFVRKHAEAVSKFCMVSVVYVHCDMNIRNFEVVVQNYKEVQEVIIYYPGKSGFPGKFFRQINYLIALYKGINMVFTKIGKPDIVHVNILTRTGIPAYLLKISLNIPYVITEHWSRYLTTRNSFKGSIRKWLTRLIVRNASLVMPITHNLKEAMLGHGLVNQNYKVINNVVEDFFFKQSSESPKQSHIKNIIHISCFDNVPKNLTGLLNVAKTISTYRNDFVLTIAGGGKDEIMIKKHADQLQLPPGQLIFTGELSPAEVAVALKQADFFLLYSNIENAPVVISESLACGKPVISTNVGGIPEMIDSSNGILVPPGDDKTLENVLNHMLDHYKEYDAQLISDNAYPKYSYEYIGKAIFTFYKQILIH